MTLDCEVWTTSVDDLCCFHEAHEPPPFTKYVYLSGCHIKKYSEV